MRELGSWSGRRPSPHPRPRARPATYLSGPAAPCGLRPVSPRGAWGSLGSQPGPAAARWGCPSAPPGAAQLPGVLPPRRAAPAAARLSPAGASHFVGSSARSGGAPPSRSSRDARSLAPAPGLRDPGVPAPGPALVPARAPPRRAAAACAAPSSRAGGSVPAAGRAVRSAGAAGSGLRGAATEPGLRVAASGRRAGGAGGGGGRGVEGEGGSARRAEEEGASERRREGRPTSSATIIRLKQVQPLSPGQAAAAGERTPRGANFRGRKVGRRHGTADLRKAGGGETPGILSALANPVARLANPSFSLESGGTAEPCSHTVHWFPAGCAWRGEWPGARSPGPVSARVLPGLPPARHCVGAGGELSDPGVGEVGRLLLGFVNAHPRRALTPFPEGEFPRKCSANR